MRKLVALTLLSSSSLVLAQSVPAWEGNHGTYQLVGCYQVSGGVRCDFLYAIKPQAKGMGIGWNVSHFETVNADGVTVPASRVALGGGGWESQTQFAVLSDRVPAKVSALLPLPKDATTIKVLLVEGKERNDIPINLSSSTTAPAGAVTSVSLPPSQAIIGGKAYNLTFTNCKVVASTYTCTTTISPTR